MNIYIYIFKEVEVSKWAKLSSSQKNMAQLPPSVQSTVPSDHWQRSAPQPREPVGHRFAIKKDTSIFACTFLSIAETGFEPVFAHLEIWSSALPLCVQSAELPISRLHRLPSSATGSGRRCSPGNPSVTGRQ